MKGLEEAHPDRSKRCHCRPNMVCRQLFVIDLYSTVCMLVLNDVDVSTVIRHVTEQIADSAARAHRVSSSQIENVE